MKKYLYLLFIATALFSCTKEEDKTPENLRQQMADKWLVRRIFTINYSAKGEPLDSLGTPATNKDFFEFKQDGSFTSTTNNGQEVTTGTYTVPNTTSFVIKQSGVNSSTTCRVINLNNDAFVFAVPQGPKVAGQSYTETKVTLFR